MKPADKDVFVNGLKLHYLEWADGGDRTMLLLHGLMAHAHAWDDFASSFHQEYRIISLDQRGHGESEWSRKVAYHLDDHLADLCRFSEILGLDRMTLVGHSMGGRNALFFAACFSEKVERLIVVDARPSSSERSSNALRQLLASFPLEADSLEAVEDAIHALYPLLPRTTVHHLARHGYRRNALGNRVPAYDTRMTLQCQEAHDPMDNLLPLLSNITCPTLIVRGEESPFLSREDAERIVNLLPRGVLREVRRSTHMPAQENPKAFEAVVRAFLNETP